MTKEMAMGTHLYDGGDYTLEESTKGNVVLWVGDNYMGIFDTTWNARSYAMDVLDNIKYRSQGAA